MRAGGCGTGQVVRVRRIDGRGLESYSLGCSLCKSCVINSIRRLVLKRLMRPDGVVLVNVFCNRATKLKRRVELADINQLLLEGSKPTFNHDVVGPPFPTVHALSNMELLKERPIFSTCELTALVAVDYGGNTVFFHSIPDRFQNMVYLERVGQFPTDDFPAVPIDNSDQVHMMAIHFDVSDIDRPVLVGKQSRFVPEQVGNDPLLAIVPGQIGLGVYGIDAHLAHI